VGVAVLDALMQREACIFRDALSSDEEIDRRDKSIE
jgi:hypothetical protein